MPANRALGLELDEVGVKHLLGSKRLADRGDLHAGELLRIGLTIIDQPIGVDNRRHVMLHQLIGHLPIEQFRHNLHRSRIAVVLDQDQHVVLRRNIDGRRLLFGHHLIQCRAKEAAAGQVDREGGQKREAQAHQNFAMR